MGRKRGNICTEVNTAMKNYSWIFFDLDGTLTDPGLGITNSVMYALERFGIRTEERSSLYKYIGPPLMDSFREFNGFDEEDCRRAVAAYREYFADRGLFENEVYPGIPALLNRLRAAGKRLCVATSKPEDFALRILRHFELDGYFDFVAGACMDETRTQKWEVIGWGLEQCGITEPGAVLMAGDRKHDVLGAARFGMDCVGILYGYGSAEELTGAGAAALVSSPAELGDYILGAVHGKEHL